MKKPYSKPELIVITVDSPEYKELIKQIEYQQNNDSTEKQ